MEGLNELEKGTAMDAAWSARIKDGEGDGFRIDGACSSKENAWINAWKRVYTSYCVLSIRIIR